MAEGEEIEIDITIADYKKAALEQLEGFGTIFDDPEFRRIMGDEMADGIKAVNDEKIAEIKEIPDA
jgi:hypothetical protein